MQHQRKSPGRMSVSFAARKWWPGNILMAPRAKPTGRDLQVGPQIDCARRNYRVATSFISHVCEAGSSGSRIAPLARAPLSSPGIVHTREMASMAAEETVVDYNPELINPWGRTDKPGMDWLGPECISL